MNLNKFRGSHLDFETQVYFLDHPNNYHIILGSFRDFFVTHNKYVYLNIKQFYIRSGSRACDHDVLDGVYRDH